MLSRMILAIILSILSLSDLALSSSAILGFNYQYDLGPISNWESAFRKQRNLVGISGFNSARVWTALTPDGSGPTLAIPAAIATNTRLHFSLSLSNIAAEIAAIGTASTNYGSNFTSLVNGISVGIHEIADGIDLANISQTIAQVKSRLPDLGLTGTPVGHDENPFVWVDASINSPSAFQTLRNSCDFFGVDPSYQNSSTATASDGVDVFNYQADLMNNIIGNKPLWTLGYGWPSHGPAGTVVGSSSGLQQVWDAVGCNELFNRTTTYWSCLIDSACSTGNTGFGILDPFGNPLFDFGCGNNSTNISTTANTTTTTTSGVPSGIPPSGTPLISSSSSSDGLTNGAKTGIGVGVGVGAVVLLVLGAALLLRRRRAKRSASMPVTNTEMDHGKRFQSELKSTSEIDSEQSTHRAELASKGQSGVHELGSRSRNLVHELPP